MGLLLHDMGADAKRRHSLFPSALRSTPLSSSSHHSHAGGNGTACLREQSHPDLSAVALPKEEPFDGGVFDDGLIDAYQRSICWNEC